MYDTRDQIVPTSVKNAQSEIEESASPKKGELTAALAQVVTLTAMLSRHVSVYSTWDPPSIIKSLLNLQTFKTPLIVLCKDWKFLKRPPVQTVMLIFFYISRNKQRAVNFFYNIHF